MKKLLIFSAVAALAGGASAQNVWTGGISDDWNDPNNWTAVAVPATGDAVQIFTYGPPNQPRITNAAFTGQLTIGKYNAPGRLTVDAGGALTTSSYLLMTEASTDTAILENSGTVAVTGAAYLNHGVTTLINNGTFSATDNIILAQDDLLASSTVTNNGQINGGVGLYLHSGTAKLVNNVGGTITNENGDFVVTFIAGSTGTVINKGIITCGGFTYAYAGNATIVNEGAWNTKSFLPGFLATCQATITNTGTITATDLYLTSAGNTIFNMEAGTINVFKFNMTQAGTGHLNLHGGTILTTYLDIDADPRNTIDITEGKLIVDGNRKPDFDYMASVGLFTAYGGKGIVIAEYDSVLNKTTLRGALPLITGQTMLAGGSFQIDFTGAASQPYRVLGTNLLTAPLATWPVLGSGNFSSGGTATFTDSNVAAGNNIRFYRIVSP